MSKDTTVGLSLLVISVAGAVVYGWLLFLSEWSTLTLQVTAFTAVVTLLAVLGWIGYTLATSPFPDLMLESESEATRHHEGPEDE
jgi:predicted DNA-binding transcriptional regulator